MAALKVQSLDDIVRAYFQTLGFDGENLSKVAAEVLDKYRGDLDGNDVIGSLDKILAGHFKSCFGDEKLNDSQRTAMFKLAFLQINGADKWGATAYLSAKWPHAMCEEIKKAAVVIAPQYKISHMEPQKIETVQPMNVMRRVVSLFHKG